MPSCVLALRLQRRVVDCSLFVLSGNERRAKPLLGSAVLQLQCRAQKTSHKRFPVLSP